MKRHDDPELTTFQVGAVELAPSRPEAAELPPSKTGSGPTSLSRNLEKPSFLGPCLETLCYLQLSLDRRTPSIPAQHPSELPPSQPICSNRLCLERPISIRPGLGRRAPSLTTWSS